jgi:hypothetical protein
MLVEVNKKTNKTAQGIRLRIESLW